MLQTPDNNLVTVEPVVDSMSYKHLKGSSELLIGSVAVCVAVNEKVNAPVAAPVIVQVKDANATVSLGFLLIFPAIVYPVRLIYAPEESLRTTLLEKVAPCSISKSYFPAAITSP